MRLTQKSRLAGCARRLLPENRARITSQSDGIDRMPCENRKPRFLAMLQSGLQSNRIVQQLQLFVLTRFLRANRYPLRSKTL
jgi:hypothetical protein